MECKVRESKEIRNLFHLVYELNNASKSLLGFSEGILRHLEHVKEDPFCGVKLLLVRVLGTKLSGHVNG